MTKFLTCACAALGLGLMTPMAQAGVIENACLKAGRKGATAQLCGCIQDAADLTLSNKDQTTAARFFADPHQAQQTRQSDRASTEAFWLRYKEFGSAAQAFCS